MSATEESRFSVIDNLWIDVRQAFRQVRRSPASSAMVILLLATGIGVSTAIFSVVHTVLLDQLPYKDPRSLVQIVSVWPKSGDQNNWGAPLRDAADWKTTVPGLQDIGMYRYALFNFATDGANAEAVYGVRVTESIMPILGVSPVLGSWFTVDQDRPGHTNVLLLSYDFWRRSFHSDPHIVGKTIHLDSQGYVVIGVMPKGFNFPLKLATTALLPTDQMQYWMPLGADLSKNPHGEPNAGVIARLRGGTTIPQAQAQLEQACRALESQFPASNKDLSAQLRSLRAQTTAQFSSPLFALLAASGLILLLTCVNIASLLLARGEAKGHELAVRLALGGSMWRVARIPILQGVTLCLFGCFLGVPFAAAIVKFLIRLAPIDVPRLAGTHLDLNAAAFGMALAILSGLAVGGMNALQVLRRSPREVLSESSRHGIGRTGARLRGALVIGQVALAVILVSGGGLMLRTFVNLLSTDTGYRPQHVSYAVNVLTQSLYPERADVMLFNKKLLDRLRATPGIEWASVATGFPMVGQYDTAKVYAQESQENQRGGVSIDLDEASPGYLEAMGLRLIAGRLIRETDTVDASKVAVVDTALANRLWPHADPLGKLVNLDDSEKPVWRQVVGVVGPARNYALDLAARPGVYIPLEQGERRPNFVVVKSPLSAAAATGLIKDAVSSLDPNQAVFFSQSMEALIHDSIGIRYFLFIVLAFFGASAVILSAIGIYGLVSFLVAARVREVGIRMALGATGSKIIGLFVFQSIRLALIGVGTGLIGALILDRTMSSLLFGVRPMDAATLLATAALLAFSAALAAFAASYRSASVEPNRALRAD